MRDSLIHTSGSFPPGELKSTVAYQGQVPLSFGSDPDKQALFARYEEVAWVEQLHWQRHYQRRKLLGAGGQGAVYLAQHDGADGFSRPIALKVFSPEPYPSRKAYEEDMGMVGRACAKVALLQSDHIVDIHDFVIHQGLRLLEMEWIDGFDLREILKPETIALTRERHPPERVEYIERVILGPGTNQPRLQPGVAISILRDCLAGLATLNQAGLVHGDIKPGNIMVTRMGRSKLIDIGSAVDLRQSTVRHVWSPAYAAPEVLEGGRSTPQSDLASLGYVLIEMLSGQFPFEGCTSYPQLAQAKRELEQRLPELIPAEVVESEMLMTLCQRLIAANPADRFPSAHAAELGEDGAAGFHRQLATVNLASEYNHDLRVWLEPLRSDATP